MFFKRACPSCNKQMHKLAEFCRHCGVDNPDAERHCMRCGKVVKGDATNCWHCSDALKKQPRGMVFNNRWVREEGVFAVRIPIETPANRLRHGVYVDAGVQAVVVYDKKTYIPLKPGYDPLTNFIERLFGWDRTRSTVDAILALSDPLDYEMVFSGEDDIYVEEVGRCSEARLILRVKLGNLKQVHQKFLMSKEIYQVLQVDLLRSMRGRLADQTRAWLATMRIEDVLRQNYNLAAFSIILREKLSGVFLDYGLEILSVESFALNPKDLDEAREKRDYQAASERHHKGMVERVRSFWEVISPHKQPVNETGGSPFLKWKERYAGCVGVAVITYAAGRTVMRQISGTVWVPDKQPAGKNIVVTNAHVVEEVEAARERGAAISVVFTGSKTGLPVSGGLKHPHYVKEVDNGKSVPIFDVGVLDVRGALPRPGLALANRQTCMALQGGITVASLGFPTENQVGGGTNMDCPQVSFRPGSVSKVETWDKKAPPDPRQGLLVTHDIPVAGGVSGSPLFDDAGRVVAIVCAGTMEFIFDPSTEEMRRTPSASQMNFAQRIDILLDWLYPEFPRERA